MAIAGPLFLVGVVLGYVTLPKGLEVLIGFNPDDVTNLLDISGYLQFFTRTLLVFGLAFEIPVFVVMLNLAGVVTGKQLGAHRPWIIVGIFIFAAVATPSADPFTMTFMAVPMVILYFISEIIARWNDRRKAARKPNAGLSPTSSPPSDPPSGDMTQWRSWRPTPIIDVDPFDLPEWLGVGQVVWHADQGLRSGHLVAGRLVSGDDVLACDLLAVDEAYPVPVTDDDSRLRAPPGVAARPGASRVVRRPAGARRAGHPLRRRARPGHPGPTGAGRRRLAGQHGCPAPHRRGEAESSLTLDRVDCMAREIALLTNPTSGKGKGARYREAALPRLRDAGLVVRNLEGRDADEALDLARASVADGVEALVVCGGDGLVHLAAQVLAGTGVPLGIIPAGTGNDVARYFDLPRKDPVAAADRVIGSRIRTVDLARSRLALLRHRPGRRLRRHRQRARQRDDVAARPDALQPRHPPRAAHLRAAAVHPRPRRRRSCSATRCSSRSATARRTAAASASPKGPCSTTGLLDVVIINTMTKPKLIRTYPKLFSGTHTGEPEYEHHRVRSVTVAAPGVVTYADGERFGELP